MACGSCSGKRTSTDYEVTFKHDGSKVTFGSLSEVRIALAQSPKGGTYQAVPRKA